ncbi:formylglycine-generating enzyme family protein [Sorangium sp. So ce1097]|uniref:formylglycine-generating enzyme family protein n=1 Tax=Sorangium sp. So ce1097 TaxID=3133330 RepID=UPI003F5FAD7B
MRPAALLTLATLASLFAVSMVGVAAPPPPSRARRAPRLPAAAEAALPASGGQRARSPASVVALRAPGAAAVLVRAGSFTMGSSEVEIAHAVTLCKLEPAGELCVEETEASFANELVAHEVYLSDFWIDRTEVTVASYRRCVSAGVCTEPPYASGGQRFDRPDFPVVLVSWSDAQRYCAWAGGRLPTEAEWERAARGVAGRRYPWGNVYNPFHANHGRLSFDELDDGDGFLELAPVGALVAGRTPDGIDDLAGNVEEWVADYYHPEYPAGSAKDPRGPDMGEERVLRGGSYIQGRPWVRGAARGHDVPTSRRAWRGFRCARDA